jgi:hypothetical protein
LVQGGGLLGDFFQGVFIGFFNGQIQQNQGFFMIAQQFFETVDFIGNNRTFF